jgi:hypothetical protein
LTTLSLAVKTLLVNSRQTLDTDLDKEDFIAMLDSIRTSAARALFLAAALLSFGLSVVLYFSGEHTSGIFVGLWVPSILALGAFLAPRRVPDETAGGSGPGR